MKKKISLMVVFLLTCTPAVFAWGWGKKDPIKELKKQLIGNCYHVIFSVRTTGALGDEGMHIAFLNDSDFEEVYERHHNMNYNGSYKTVSRYSFVDNGDGSFSFHRGGGEYQYLKVWWKEGAVKEIWLIKSPKDTRGYNLELCEEKRDWKDPNYSSYSSSLHDQKFPKYSWDKE